ncbi:hypothetical protein NQ318_005383 [Aromia moschata]|uniref:Uncharacterized protein n=1 Tax=Aromia moschata TaxID=1265417 RepID=A0AAV8YYL0_9CUCU|nr:hypothetical protein NQ318_005383 [Aromia moschata]
MGRVKACASTNLPPERCIWQRGLRPRDGPSARISESIRPHSERPKVTGESARDSRRPNRETADSDLPSESAIGAETSVGDSFGREELCAWRFRVRVAVYLILTEGF